MQDSDPDRWFSELPPWALPVALTTLTGSVFLADVLTPLGVATWIPYLPLCVVVAWLSRPRTTVLVSLVATALIVLGGFLSPPGAPDWVAITNRIIGAVALWLAIVAIILLRKFGRVREQRNARLLHDANARLSSVLDGAEDAIISTDENQNVTLFNRGAERVFGYSAGDVIGRNLKLLLPTKVADTHQKFVADFAQSPMQSRRMGERRAVAGRRRDGSEFPAEVSISKAVLASGTTFTAIVRDITDREKIEQSLEARVAERTASLKEEIERREEAQTALVRSQKLQAVGELAGGIAHDFNNLLTVITGNLELLGFRQLDDKARDHIRRADEAAKMGARLAGRLLAIGRKQRLQPVALDLNEIAKSMSDVLRRTLGDAISIETSFAANLWYATADISEVENAILNLAVNARDAMPHGGKLVIKTVNTSLGADDVVGEAGLKPGDYVLLSVADSGVGMSPDVLARVFEPYFTTKEAGRGTGLGLSTIYGFAKQVGGHLTIYSEIGKGTSVKLYLPRSGEAAAAETRAAASPQMQAEGETILVVEDNADVRDVTVKRLDMLGYRVLIAENAPRAIETLKAGSKIDLVFSDVMMPGGMSGFDLANWIRANRPEIKVLLTSGFTGEIARNGEKAAADIEVLRKPYATADLARAVRETLNP